MEVNTRAAITNALDVAIASVAEKEIERLSTGFTTTQTTTSICSSLRALEQLRRGIKPDYSDEWVAVFYSLWYQPAQINLAYTCAQRIPNDRNPVVTGKGDLQVFDFGCGALAMKFGLALAAADALHEGGYNHTITICSDDESEAMKRIGKRIWCDFLDEIENVANAEKSSGIDAVWYACEEILRDGRIDSSERTRWLTALHVAYKANASEVKRSLNRLVNVWSPDAVLVTSQPWFAEHRFRPHRLYRPNWNETLKSIPQSHTPNSERLNLEGELSSTSRLRLRLYEGITGSLEDRDRRFVSSYLTDQPVRWTGRTDLEAVAYVRQP